jgi:trehalose-6-phosphate synthase
MASALALDELDRKARIRRMAETVKRTDVFRWVADELADIEEGFSRP